MRRPRRAASPRASRRARRARPRRGTSRSASEPRRSRRTRGRRGPSRPTASRTPRARASSLREYARGTRRNRTASRAGEDAELGAARRLASRPRSRGRSGGRACPSRSAGRPRRTSCAANGVSSSTPTHSRQTVETIVSISRAGTPGRERHLDVELRDLLHAVGAEILVAEADRDLVVALEPADHEQLLAICGDCGSAIEATRLQARRARGSRARPRVSASSRIGVWMSTKPARLHDPPDRADHLAAEANVALQLRSPAGRASGTACARCRRRSPRRAGTAAASERETISSESTCTSIAPVGRFGFTSSARASDDLAARPETTNSFRSSCAAATAAGARSGLTTS